MNYDMKTCIFQSINIVDSIYQCNWYDGHVKFQRIIPFLLHRSQQPEKLTVYKFATVSYDSFGDVSFKQNKKLCAIFFHKSK